MLRSTDDIIESLVCPPPPSDPAMMSEEMISGLIVPAPNWRKCIEMLSLPKMRLFNYLKLDYLPSQMRAIKKNRSVKTGRPEHHELVTSDYINDGRGGGKVSSRTSSFEIENLLKTAEQVTTYCRSPQETRKSSPTGSVTSSASNAVLTPSRQLTDAEKLRKVILELVDTERAYVKVKFNIFCHPFFSSTLSLTFEIEKKGERIVIEEK